MSEEDPIEGLRAVCATIGFDLDGVDRSLVDRVRVLAEQSRTVDDARRMTSYAERIFRHYDVVKPSQAFGSLERKTVILACIFSDIGKTGPAGADVEDARLVAAAFAVENVRDDTQTVDTFLRTYFPADAEHRIARFVAIGIDPAMSMRQFWNLHSSWTLAITEGAGVPLEACAAAASHHLVDDVNPRSIVDANDRFTRRFGANDAFDRTEKLVIVLDKYDAATRRGGLDHARAIAWVRERIARSARFRGDAELATLVADVDTVLGAD